VPAPARHADGICNCLLPLQFFAHN
jgi:hypothetical protein